MVFTTAAGFYPNLHCGQFCSVAVVWKNAFATNSVRIPSMLLPFVCECFNLCDSPCEQYAKFARRTCTIFEYATAYSISSCAASSYIWLLVSQSHCAYIHCLCVHQNKHTGLLNSSQRVQQYRDTVVYTCIMHCLVLLLQLELLLHVKRLPTHPCYTNALPSHTSHCS
jgi:hypothetical protein